MVPMDELLQTKYVLLVDRLSVFRLLDVFVSLLLYSVFFCILNNCVGLVLIVYRILSFILFANKDNVQLSGHTVLPSTLRMKFV